MDEFTASLDPTYKICAPATANRIAQALAAAQHSDSDSGLLVLADAGYPSTLPVAVPVAVAGPGSHASVDTAVCPGRTAVETQTRVQAVRLY